MKHIAPSIVIEIQRNAHPNLSWFRTLEPTWEDTDIYPLGTAQPGYKVTPALRTESDAAELRIVKLDGFQHLLWPEIPEYFREFLTDQVGEDFSQVSIWVKGDLPTQRIDATEPETVGVP